MCDTHRVVSYLVAYGENSRETRSTVKKSSAPSDWKLAIELWVIDCEFAPRSKAMPTRIFSHLRKPASSFRAALEVCLVAGQSFRLDCTKSQIHAGLFANSSRLCARRALLLRCSWWREPEQVRSLSNVGLSSCFVFSVTPLWRCGTEPPDGGARVRDGPHALALCGGLLT